MPESLDLIAAVAGKGASPFEVLMLVCFGAAWPFSIAKSYTSRKNAGKSILFLFILVLGYASGIVHKLCYHQDRVVWLYALNGLMVTVDIALYFRNMRIEKSAGRAGGNAI